MNSNHGSTNVNVVVVGPMHQWTYSNHRKTALLHSQSTFTADCSELVSSMGQWFLILLAKKAFAAKFLKVFGTHSNHGLKL